MCRISRRTEKLFFGKQICAVPVVSWSTGLKPFCVCAEKDFVGRFLCTNITTESEIESKCKFKNEHFFRRFHINNMRPSAPCSRQMTVQILRIIHSFSFIRTNMKMRREKNEPKLLFAFNAAINQCCCRHDDFKLLIHLFYLFKVNESQNLLDVHKFTG